MIDSANHFEVVPVDGPGKELRFKPFSNVPYCRVSRAMAINLAAWLIVIADQADRDSDVSAFVEVQRLRDVIEKERFG